MATAVSTIRPTTTTRRTSVRVRCCLRCEEEDLGYTSSCLRRRTRRSQCESEGEEKGGHEGEVDVYLDAPRYQDAIPAPVRRRRPDRPRRRQQQRQQQQQRLQRRAGLMLGGWILLLLTATATTAAAAAAFSIRSSSIATVHRRDSIRPRDAHHRQHRHYRMRRQQQQQQQQQLQQQQPRRQSHRVLRTLLLGASSPPDWAPVNGEGANRSDNDGKDEDEDEYNDEIGTYRGDIDDDDDVICWKDTTGDGIVERQEEVEESHDLVPQDFYQSMRNQQEQQPQQPPPPQKTPSDEDSSGPAFKECDKAAGVPNFTMEALRGSDSPSPVLDEDRGNNKEMGSTRAPQQSDPGGTSNQQPPTSKKKKQQPSSSASSKSTAPSTSASKMELMWCTNDFCRDAVRERVVGEHNQILLNGPATGQVAYQWKRQRDVSRNKPYQLPTGDTRNNEDPNNLRDGDSSSSYDARSADEDESDDEQDPVVEPTVLVMIKQVASDTPDPRLLKVAAHAVEELTQQFGVHVLLEPTTAARLKHYHGVDGPRIHLFENQPTPGFGTNLKPNEVSMMDDDIVDDGNEYGEDQEDSFGVSGTRRSSSSMSSSRSLMPHRIPGLAGRYAAAPSHTHPDLICTLGGDGLLMHVGMMFQGPAPPILCISGGSMGFLTPFFPDEMVEAICISLGIRMRNHDEDDGTRTPAGVDAADIDVYPPNMPSYPYEPLPTPSNRRKATSTRGSTGRSAKSGGDRGGVAANTNLPAPSSATFGLGNRICLSIRMRLECRVLNAEGIVRSRYNVLNEVVIDRGSSPYLAALECFVDDVHLTTVQADGVIFATPTGSTAYSLAAGSSVVHPAVPCILVTPICPHVLSFRSMVFPDHVVLRCYVPLDARSEASVAFDGKHRQGLARGDSVQVQMSLYPVPTINKLDHSSDWLSSLKRSFSFNTRARQEPL